MADDEQDNPGILLPPPLTYLLTLALGLLLDRRLHVPFLPRGVARALGWPLLGGGVLLNEWFLFTMRRADTPIDPRKPVSRLITEGPFRYTRNPAYLSLTMIYVGPFSPPAVGAVSDPARPDRARGALPGAHLREGVPGLQG
jgi:protein-S-isoprenylcysteine O-methyltransferase Ste14